MQAFYSDLFVLPLPEGHRFPMEKYRLLREGVVAAGLVDPEDLHILPGGDRRGCPCSPPPAASASASDPRLLKAPRGLVELPPGYRRAAVYSLLAALRLLSRIEDADADLLDRPPHLGLWERLGLLARARWFRAG